MPDLDVNTIVNVAKREVSQELRVMGVAVITAVARATSRVAAGFVARFMDTTMQARDEQPVIDVPIAHYSAGGYGVFMDPALGDPIVLVAGDAASRPFFETGESFTPQIAQPHSFANSLAFLGGRVSSSVPGQATAPPNGPGEFTCGANDGSATLIARGRGLTSPLEQGTVIIATTTHLPPAFSLLLGGPAALLGVARNTDPVAPTSAMVAYLSAVAAAANIIAPGSVSPGVLAAVLLQVGAISGASLKVSVE